MNLEFLETFDKLDSKHTHFGHGMPLCAQVNTHSGSIYHIGKTAPEETQETLRAYVTIREKYQTFREHICLCANAGAVFSCLACRLSYFNWFKGSVC